MAGAAVLGSGAAEQRGLGAGGGVARRQHVGRRVYGVSEQQVRSEWAEQSIDLSPWKNQSNLRIRFHLWTDGGGTEDGWSVDDLRVAEHVPVTVG